MNRAKAIVSPSDINEISNLAKQLGADEDSASELLYSLNFLSNRQHQMTPVDRLRFKKVYLQAAEISGSQIGLFNPR
jgi:hypothetical protein